MPERISGLSLAAGPDVSPGRERLRQIADQLDAPLVVVANREPYVHERTDAGVVVQRPPSGLVTGIEPVLRACGGTWVAHGSGSADFETAGPDGVIAVPPEEPEYDLRRIFLTPGEIEGYYCGFANEALWPLCHRAWTQPVLRHEDWEAYRRVNRRFARAAAEAKGTLVLVDLRETAGAILRAVRMPAAERTARLRQMRRALERNTIDDWAVGQLADLARVRAGRRVEWNREDVERESAARHGL